MRYILFFLSACVVSVACSSANKTHNWSDLESVSVTQELSIPITDIDKETLIADFSGLTVDQAGRILVADTKSQKIHVFSPKGAYIQSIGRSGKGPGEFERMDADIQVMADTLYVKQNQMHRIDLFDLNKMEHIRSVTIPRKKIGGISLGTPRNLYPLRNGNMLISFIVPYFLKPKKDSPAKQFTISTIDPRGNFINDHLLQQPTLYPTDQKIVYQASRSMAVYTNLQIYPNTFFVADPKGSGDFFIGNSDSLKFKKYSKEGTLQSTTPENFTHS
ncbi:MAG: 6-bladed beta-propeller [Balneolaceae bacterium]|nr:6-bladed beta-propeller [Balneolaceae bacterium]